MNTLEILLQQIGLFVIYILAGMILVKTKVLNSETLDPISRFVIKMALPVMIFVNIIDGVERDTLFHSLSILVIAAVFYICTFIISLGMTKIFHRCFYLEMSVSWESRSSRVFFHRMESSMFQYLP